MSDPFISFQRKTSMSECNHIKDILNDEFIGKKVKLKGWVYRHRASSKLVFIILRDSTDVIQCVVKSDSEFFEAAKDLYIESSIEIEGTLRKDDRAPTGYEIDVEKLNLICKGEPFPVTKDQSVEFLLDIRHLWLRSMKLTRILEARHYIIEYLREFLDKEGFYEVPAPLITKSGAEGGSEVFEIDYFGEKAYLTQSSQLYAEAAIFALEKVYVLAPSFRAEPSRTRRHLAEYWHLEPEMAFYNNKMNMEIQERMVEYVCNKMGKEHGSLVKKIGRDPEYLLGIKSPFERISYEEAIDRANKLGCKMKLGDDFGADEEYILTKDLKQPIFITDFPMELKAFYMAENPNNPGHALCSDLLAPEGHGEIIGGSEREWRYEVLMDRIKENKLNVKDYEWYLDLRKYGSVPHSGFGLGIERFIKWMLNLKHIRDAIPFPRTINRFYP